MKQLNWNRNEIYLDDVIIIDQGKHLEVIGLQSEFELPEGATVHLSADIRLPYTGSRDKAARELASIANDYMLQAWIDSQGGGMTQLQGAMARLDLYLTSAPKRNILSQIHHKFAMPQDWLESEDLTWYLSDGGYSRVVLNRERWEAGETSDLIFLASESRDEVKKVWKANNIIVPGAIRAVERLLSEYRKEYQEDDS